ncbi:MAG: hypothetical protein HYT66_00030 [Candidatus Yanofskybacteria bacterium]|nr:hypothetical protein [Candidatus Yanofskybacteria bacterium]
MDLDKEQFEFVRPLKWIDVLDIWRNNEINEGHWKEYYQAKGFKSWENWRKKYIDAYASLGKDWYLAKVKDPILSVPSFRGGNYKGWKENIYEGRELPTFREMKEHPAAAGFLKNLPRETTIIALNTDIGIVIIEGMHRCAAIAKAAKEGMPLNLDLYIAMTNVDKEEIPDFTKE